MPFAPSSVLYSPQAERPSTPQERSETSLVADVEARLQWKSSRSIEPALDGFMPDSILLLGVTHLG